MTAVLLIVLLFGCAGSNNKQPKAMPHYTLGLSYLQSENPTLALREFLKAVENNPKNPQVHAGLARAYQYKKAYGLAEQHYIKALMYSDNEPKYQNNLAALYISMERWDQAIEYFQKASENLLFMRSELALMGKGYAYYRKGDYPAALQAYREAEIIAPRLAVLHFHIGETYAALGQQELAIASYEKALLHVPTYSEARYQLAVLLLKGQQIDDAKELLALIVEQDPLSDWGMKANDFLKALK
jgi:Tfp pilus assembly protein PilF